MQALHIKRDCFLARPARSITISKWRGILLTMMEEVCRGHSAIMCSRVKAWHFFHSLPAVMLLGWTSSGLCNNRSLSEPTAPLVSDSWSQGVYMTPVLWPWRALRTLFNGRHAGFKHLNTPPFPLRFQACIRISIIRSVPVECFQALAFALPCFFCAN